MPFRQCDSLMSKILNFTTETGGAEYLINGTVKLLNNSPIEQFTKTGLKFEDGSKLNADVVVCATGSVTLFQGFLLDVSLRHIYSHTDSKVLGRSLKSFSIRRLLRKSRRYGDWTKRVNCVEPGAILASQTCGA